DDTFAYIVDRNPAYVASNLGNLTLLRDVNLPVVGFYDTRGECLFFQAVDFSDLSAIDLDCLPILRPGTGGPPFDHASLESTTNGMVLTERGPLLLSSKPIIGSNQEGPIRGTIIMGRFLDDATIDRLKDQIHVDFELAVLETEVEPGIQIDAIHDDRLLATTFLDGLNRQPILQIRAHLDRKITARGRSAMRAALGSLAAARLATLVLLGMILRRLVIGPLAHLTSKVVEVGRNGDLNQPLGIDRADELGQLAGEFDGMMLKLARSRAQLADASRQTGRAEVAVDVLHNVGNALNSVTVSVSLLGDRIRGSRMGGLDAAARIHLFESPRSEIPIIALTADVVTIDRAQCQASGIEWLLAKPFTAIELFALMKDVQAQA
ncbi:MAG: HAMP domain-containing protein, partial [Planctomycetes bacterium]|nr:HAMP domain-containing protein [Planctomycetota bacterium]